MHSYLTWELRERYINKYIKYIKPSMYSLCPLENLRMTKFTYSNCDVPFQYRKCTLGSMWWGYLILLAPFVLSVLVKTDGCYWMKKGRRKIGSRLQAQYVYHLSSYLHSLEMAENIFLLRIISKTMPENKNYYHQWANIVWKIPRG